MIDVVVAPILNPYLLDLPDYDEFGRITPKAIAIQDIPNDISAAAQYIPEWAARLCYKSNSKFGTNPNFLAGLMKVGHYDVIEHTSLTMAITVDNLDYKSLFELIQTNKFIRINIVEERSNYTVFLITANLRVWKELIPAKEQGLTSLQMAFSNVFIDSGIRGEQWYRYFDYMRTVLLEVAPSLFMEFMPTNKNAVTNAVDDLSNYYKAARSYLNSRIKNGQAINQITTSTGATVTLLGSTPIVNIDGTDYTSTAHAAFQIDNVSRAFTHQHVRHRLLSFSQESQRYVDISKSGTRVVYPPNANSRVVKEIDDFMSYAEHTYRKLRKLEARKEDARAVLPNCITTRIITSGYYFQGWDHYIDLRTDKAAQAEIREVAEAIESIFKEAVI